MYHFTSATNGGLSATNEGLSSSIPTNRDYFIVINRTNKGNLISKFIRKSCYTEYKNIEALRDYIKQTYNVYVPDNKFQEIDGKISVNYCLDGNVKSSINMIKLDDTLVIDNNNKKEKYITYIAY
jgi:hypothetical protein